MTDDRTCPLTGEPLPADRYVSRAATGTLRGLLTDLPGLMFDLEGALTKQLHFAAQVGGRSTSNPMPMDYAASEAGYVARQTILTWVDWITAVRAHRCPETWAEVASYLRDFGGIEWVARHPDGPQVVDELTAALRHARRAVDRPAERLYVGVCGGTTVDGDGLVQECTQPLYGRVDRDDVECPRCGTTWAVTDRQAAMLRRLRDHHLPAADLARAFERLGVGVTFDRIRQWKRRGVIAPAVRAGKPMADGSGRPLYRVGDVLDAALREHAQAG